MLLGFEILAACGLMLYGLAPFFLFSLRWSILLDLTYFPLYALWKFTMAFRRPPARWIRTTREPPSSASRSDETGTTLPSNGGATGAGLLPR
jgi:hypothetical protein